MDEDKDRIPEPPGEHTARGGEQTTEPEDARDQPLGPATPDQRRPLGDTPEAHDEIIPEDLPKDHPGRHEAERQAEAGDGTARGNT